MNGLTTRILELGAQGLCCAQIMASLALETGEKENPDLLRAAKGLCGGLGGTGGLCGILSGGVIFLGLLMEDGGEIQEASRDLTEWFKDRWGSSDCSDLTKNAREDERASICHAIMAETVQKCLSILESLEQGEIHDP